MATFDDGGTAGSVTLTMSAPNLTPDPNGLTDDEHVNEWNFNLDPNFDPTSLVFSSPTTVSGAFGPITINTGVNAFQANGDGFFDIMFMFSITNGAKIKFTQGDAVSFDITGIPTLTANSFNFPSFQDGGQGTFPTAAQVLGIGDLDESGWITIPEPTSGMLLLAGCFAGGLFAARRKRRALNR
ncbi:MAG: PEP-CTERM sorting domain-containing protein [Planctomycetes bacterium]|nr:PEP-CTERM sorting domain-containing protein [Planctomycetota bacterium]